MRTFSCDKHGVQTEGKFDGYNFGDRILEGVKFRIVFSSEAVSIDPAFDDDYWHDLNTKKWLKEAGKFAKQNDVFECVHCGDDIYEEATPNGN